MGSSVRIELDFWKGGFGEAGARPPVRTNFAVRTGCELVRSWAGCGVSKP